MIDSHAHIDSVDFDNDREEMLERAFSGGIESIIIPAIEPKGFDKIIEITNYDSKIYCSMGIHPHNAKEATSENLGTIINNLKNKKVIAIGEIGLDYYYDFAPQDLQRDVFRQQLKIAKEYNLPVIVHNRKADEDLMKILEEEQDGSLSGVLHCFSSPVATMKQAVELGFNISFTGNITFKKTNLGEVVKETPIESILLETDSPYMTPVPNRGKRNEPLFVKYVAEKIAEYKNLTINEVINMTTRNAKNLFRIAVLVAIFLISSVSTFSQSSKSQQSASDEQAGDKPQEKFVNPYNKFFGFGPVIGFNTIVETEYLSLLDSKNKDIDVTYEGVPAFGATITYSPLDFLVLDISYIYSKNKKISEKSNYLLPPSIYQFYEFTSQWISNPYNRVNIYATIGAGFIIADINNKISNQTCFIAGIGFAVNIKTKVGLFTPSFEWRLNYALGKSNGGVFYNPLEPKSPPKDVKISTYFSIPRVGIVWYPKALANLIGVD